MKKSLVNIDFFLVNFTPFMKRIFYFSPIIYQILSLIPLVAILPKQCSYPRLVVPIFTLCLGIFVYYQKGYFDFVLLTPLLLNISYQYYSKLSFIQFQERFFTLYVIVLLYAIYQKIFGYTFFELGWIRSGLGSVSELGYFIVDEIRPFSFLAGTPELAFFIAGFMYYFLTTKQWKWLIVSMMMLLVVGSRGVLIGVLVSLAVTNYSKYLMGSYRFLLTLSFFLSLLLYFFLIYIYPEVLAPWLLSFDFLEGSRILVYGTFNARLELLNDIFFDYDIYSFFFGASHRIDVADNLFAFLIYNYGVAPLIFLLGFILYHCRSMKNLFLSSIYISYMFYADLALSFFVSYNFYLWIAMNEENTDSI